MQVKPFFCYKYQNIEILVISKDIRKLILKNATTIEIQEQAGKEGMKTLSQACIEMALRGASTIEQRYCCHNGELNDMPADNRESGVSTI